MVCEYHQQCQIHLAILWISCLSPPEILPPSEVAPNSNLVYLFQPELPANVVRYDFLSSFSLWYPGLVSISVKIFTHASAVEICYSQLGLCILILSVTDLTLLHWSITICSCSAFGPVWSCCSTLISKGVEIVLFAGILISLFHRNCSSVLFSCLDIS